MSACWCVLNDIIVSFPSSRPAELRVRDCACARVCVCVCVLRVRCGRLHLKIKCYPCSQALKVLSLEIAVSHRCVDRAFVSSAQAWTAGATVGSGAALHAILVSVTYGIQLWDGSETNQRTR